MSTHNIGFYEDLTQIIFQLSSNTYLDSSSLYTSTYQHKRIRSVNVVRFVYCHMVLTQTYHVLPSFIHHMGLATKIIF